MPDEEAIREEIERLEAEKRNGKILSRHILFDLSKYWKLKSWKLRLRRKRRN